MPMGVVLAAGTVARARVPRGRRRAPPARAEQSRGGVSGAPRRRARGDRARHVRALRPPAHRAAEVQHDAPGPDARARRVRRGRARAAAHAPRARACCSSRATSATGRSTRSCTRSRCTRCRCWRGRSTTRCCTTCSSACAAAPATRVIYRRGAVRRVLRALAANQAVAVLIDQHIQTADAVYVDFFNRPAATTSALAALALRTGAPVIPGVRAAAAGRTVPHGLRARRRSAARGQSRRAPRLHAALHRRPRDVRAPVSRASGSGCTAAGATSSRRTTMRAACSPRPRPRTDEWPEVRRLIVRAPNWLGDAVMALPALAAVRRAFDGRTIILAATPAIAPLFEERTSARPDEILTVDRAREAAQLTRRARGRDPAAAQLLRQRLDGQARRHRPNAGATRADWRRLLLTRAVPRPRRAVHQVEYYLELVRGLGIEAGRRRITAADRAGPVHAPEGRRDPRRPPASRPASASSVSRRARPTATPSGGRPSASRRSIAGIDATAVLRRRRRRPRNRACDRIVAAARRARRQPDRPDDAAAARGGRRALRRVRVQRFGRDARRRRARRAADRDLRADRRTGHRPGGRRRRDSRERSSAGPACCASVQSTTGA